MSGATPLQGFKQVQVALLDLSRVWLSLVEKFAIDLGAGAILRTDSCLVEQVHALSTADHKIGRSAMLSHRSVGA